MKETYCLHSACDTTCSQLGSKSDWFLISRARHVGYLLMGVVREEVVRVLNQPLVEGCELDVKRALRWYSNV